jgi:DNA-binding NarL/FixJ family response regulator
MGPSRRAIRVVVGDSDLLAREGITRIVEQLDGIEPLASSGDLSTLRTLIDRFEPDVVVTDIRLAPAYEDEGIQLAAELRRTHPRAAVIVLSEHPQTKHPTTLFASGSERRGYLLKESMADPDDLGHAIREVAAGGAVVDPSVIDALVATYGIDEPSSLARLTPREREILALIAEGASNNAIAVRVGIAKRTVERHVNAIYAKLDLAASDDVSPRVAAVLALLAGEVRPPGPSSDV